MAINSKALLFGCLFLVVCINNDLIKTLSVAMEIYISSKMQLVINQYTIGIHLEDFYLFIFIFIL